MRTNELFINGIDASTLGVMMGNDFIANLAAPTGLKDFIDNESRLEDGVQRIHNTPKQDNRDVTLEFSVIGSSTADFLSKLNDFKIILYKGLVAIRVSVLGETYYLTYNKSQTFSMSTTRRTAKIAVKFNESNPTNRT